MISRSLVLTLICSVTATFVYSNNPQKRHFNNLAQALLKGKIDSNVERVIIKEADDNGSIIETDAAITTTEKSEYSTARLLPLAGVAFWTVPMALVGGIRFTDLTSYNGEWLGASSVTLGTLLTIAYTLLQKNNTVRSLSAITKQDDELIDGTNEISLYSPVKNTYWKALPRNVAIALAVHAAAFVGGAFTSIVLK